LTDYAFEVDGEDDDSVVSRCAHIMPFCLGGDHVNSRPFVDVHRTTDIYSQELTLGAIDSFTGRTIFAGTILENINHSRNVFKIENNARDYFDKQVVEFTGQVSQYFMFLSGC
jgi:hypothetical protein